MKLIDLFTKNLTPAQKQYEAVRAVAFGEDTLNGIARRFGYTAGSLNTLVNRVRSGKQSLFPEVRKGPRGPRTAPEILKKIVKLRRKAKISSREIRNELEKAGIRIGVRTVERALADAGFPKLQRRTREEMGLTTKGTAIPMRCEGLDLKDLKPFRAECQVAGVFLFLPYIIESGLLDIVSQCPLPESRDVGKTHAALSMLLVKLIGGERLSHTRQYDTDRGFGLFAGLNVLPKPTWMCTYSCRATEPLLLDFQSRVMARLRSLYPDLYDGKTINLDFHSIPHFGDKPEMEKVWCGARGKAMKGANTFFAQDGDTNQVLYARADIKRAESSDEIKKFIDFWVGVKGVVDETLVFDAKVTRYDVLCDLDQAGVRFITLRIKNKKLVQETLRIPDSQWEKVYLPIPKRKHKHVKVYESRVTLIKGGPSFRQIAIKDHGRAQPSFVLSNHENLKVKDVLAIYARRWHIENKLAELVKFFNLNALSSPFMVRIHFDILWTIIADSLYHLLARDLRRFERLRAPSLFRQFIDIPGEVHYDGKKIMVRIRKRAATPVLLAVEKLNRETPVPWLDNRPLQIVWTP